MKNKLGEKVISFKKRKCDTLDELKERHSKYFYIYGDLITDLRKGKNNEIIDLLSNSTKLVIVGSAIPADIPFFYTGSNNHFYEWIDLIEGTCLQKYAINKDISKIKIAMSDLKIIFLDLVDWCFSIKGSSKDIDILSYTIDLESFNRLKEFKEILKDDLKIISITEDVNKTLNALGIENEYHQFFPCPKRNPSWRDIENTWIPILKENL